MTHVGFRTNVLIALVASLVASRPPLAAEPISAAYLQDVEQIKALQRRYLTLYDLVEGRASDGLDVLEIVDELFTPDGEWIAVFGNGRKEIFRGREQLVGMLEGVSRRHLSDPGHAVKHQGYNPNVRVHGDSATLKAQFVVLHSGGRDERAIWVVGHYSDLLERDAHGNWRFKSKVVHVEDLTYWRKTRAD